MHDIKLTVTVPGADRAGIVHLAPCEASAMARELISNLEAAGYHPWTEAE
jgi:hypothetical protein